MFERKALSSRKLCNHERVDKSLEVNSQPKINPMPTKIGSHPTFDGMTTGGYSVIMLKIEQNSAMIKAFMY